MCGKKKVLELELLFSIVHDCVNCSIKIIKLPRLFNSVQTRDGEISGLGSVSMVH